MSENGSTEIIPAPAKASGMTVAQIAEAMVKSGFFRDVKDVSQAIVKILAGREVGLGPMASMTNIYVIDGKPAMNAQIMAARIQSSGTHRYRVDVLTDEECTLTFLERTEAGWIPIGESRFTLADADRAELLGKQSWRKYPRNLLFARALSNGARWYCPHLVLAAPYTPEELGAEVDADGDVIDLPPALPSVPPPAPESPAKAEAPAMPKPESKPGLGPSNAAIQAAWQAWLDAVELELGQETWRDLFGSASQWATLVRDDPYAAVETLEEWSDDVDVGAATVAALRACAILRENGRTPKPASEAQAKFVAATGNELLGDEAEYHALLQVVFGVQSAKDLAMSQAGAFLTFTRSDGELREKAGHYIRQAYAAITRQASLFE